MGSYGKIWYLFLLYLFTFHSFVHVLKKCMSSNHRMSLKVSKRWVLIAATLECRWWSTAECWLKLCQDPRLHFVPVVFYIRLSCQLHPDDKRLVFIIRQGSALRWRYVSCHPLLIYSLHSLFFVVVDFFIYIICKIISFVWTLFSDKINHNKIYNNFYLFK
jgi:hypothetical protein